jgi:hypothetical protein
METTVHLHSIYKFSSHLIENNATQLKSSIEMLIGKITKVYYLSEREVLRTKTVGKSNILHPALFSLKSAGLEITKQKTALALKLCNAYIPYLVL